MEKALNKRAYKMAGWDTNDELKATLAQAKKIKRTQNKRIKPQVKSDDESSADKHPTGQDSTHGKGKNHNNNQSHGHSHKHNHERSHDHKHQHGHAHEDCHSGDSHDHCHKHETDQHTPGKLHVHNENCKHDPQTGHSHEHGDRHKERFGISSFAFTARRPFEPNRLNAVLAGFNVTSNSHTSERDLSSPLRHVIRSKGFLWISPLNDEMFYWSHAGAHLQIISAGTWWAALEDVDMLDDEIKMDFQEPYGDRRQEIVFIGIHMNEAAIREKFEAALLTHEEFEQFKKLY